VHGLPFIVDLLSEVVLRPRITDEEVSICALYWIICVFYFFLDLCRVRDVWPVNSRDVKRASINRCLNLKAMINLANR